LIKARASKLAKILFFLVFVGFLFAPQVFAENLRVDRILGKAEIMNITTSQARQASALEDFHAGEKILLQKTGGLSLRMPRGNSSIFLEGGADFENGGTSESGRLRYILHRGTIWLRIMEKMDLEIRTPLAVVSIRGTEFGVTADSTFTYVHVVRGKVSVTDNAGHETILEAGDSTTVSAYADLLGALTGNEGPMPLIPLPFQKLTEARSDNRGNGDKKPGNHPGGGTPPGGGGGTPPF